MTICQPQPVHFADVLVLVSCALARICICIGVGFEVGCTLMQLTELAEITALTFAVEAEILKQLKRVTGDGITKMLNGSFRCLQ